MSQLLPRFEVSAMAFSTGAAGYVWYWVVLVGAALSELFQPGRPAQTEAGPRITVNIGLGVINAAIVIVPFLSELGLAQFAQQRHWGLFGAIALNGWVALGASILLFDFWFYLRHRLEHRLPLLWRLHRVHHSDADMDLSTTFRTHPVDALFGIAFDMVLIVSIGLAPLAVALHAVARQMVMAWGHTNLRARPRFSKAVAVVLVTPAFHARHHSAAQHETDSNYGIVFTFWDRLFGTRSSGTAPVERFGLGDTYDLDAAGFASQLKLPFIER